MTNRKMEYRVIPPEADAEFAARMEEVLDTYEKPYNANIPVLCMDEQPVQLIVRVQPCAIKSLLNCRFSAVFPVLWLPTNEPPAFLCFYVNVLVFTVFTDRFSDWRSWPLHSAEVFQLIKETRTPIEPTLHHGKRVDYEYERAGTANIFMFTEPLSGWREVSVRERKTKIDWAIEMARPLEGRYAGAEKVIVVCDNLNTHTKGAFHEAFEPERARRLVRHIEFRYTPKHGSWLNISENELSSVTRQCVAGRRIGVINTLRKETTAWSTDVNASQRGVDWQMKVEDARCKLKSVYPKIKL